MDLWGDYSTWEVINYDSAFFRAEGTNANAFNGDRQAEGLPDLSGNLSGVYLRGRSNLNANGVFSRTTFRNSGYCGYSGLQGKETEFLQFYASSSNPIYGRSAHVTPENYTYRIWKRIN